MNNNYCSNWNASGFKTHISFNISPNYLSMNYSFIPETVVEIHTQTLTKNLIPLIKTKFT